jgi:pimeloyl-ACP methyl ester carboxylesterase
MTIHHWFESGNYTLLAHADLPERHGPTGLVIVPPFGWEDVSSYRPLRFLAQMLSANGIPVLRFDLPGTGDSSGSVEDSGLVDAWVRSVGDAAEELRAIAGVQDVALLGVRLGATLAAAAVSRGANVRDLILWGASASGRADFRELRAYAAMERWEFDPGPRDETQPAPGFEVGGFLITPEMQHDWESIDLTQLPMGGQRVLLLSRDELQPDAKLVRAFESSGCRVAVQGGPGYAAMMTQPHEAVPPLEVAATVGRFLDAGPLVATTAFDPRRAMTHEGAAPARESVYTIGPEGDSIFGILTEPAGSVARADLCVLFLNAGGVRHTGPNRMWVEAARRHALRGITSLRLDLLGIGESGGEPVLDIPDLYQEELVDQVEAAIASLRSRFGFQRFVTIGLCSGAFWAFHAALRNPSIRDAILLNPRLFFWDPEADRRRALRRGVKGLVSPSDWWRVLRGGLTAEDLKRAARNALNTAQTNLTGALTEPQIPAKRMADAWKAIHRNGTRITLVFNEREPLLLEMEEEGQLPDADDACIKCIRPGKTGHTFRPKWAQKIAHEVIDKEVAAVLSETPLAQKRVWLPRASARHG